ncbi:MAG: hypothetical protein IPG99_05400 [Ignavibacteria bacterium]|nr:hypothetical protein [Ignavibacteria bacterium]
MDRFKRFTSVLAAVALIVFTGWQMSGSVSGSSASQYANLNEIKNIILYSPVDGWTITAKIGSTVYGECGPTHSGGACSITGLAAGTYTLYITRNGCTGSMNVYHPGSGITTVYWGPTNPDLDCAR